MDTRLDAQTDTDSIQRVDAARERYINREVSWLEFNGRVLELAEDDAVPLLERAKFLAIFSSNLDEFFQVRVAGLKDQLLAGLSTSGIDGLSPGSQLRRVREHVERLFKRQSRAYRELIAPGLSKAGVCLVDWPDLDAEDRSHLSTVFSERIFPVLTPLAVDPGHPFPYISNLSLNLAVVVADPVSKTRRFARVKVPPILPRFVELPDGQRFIPLEQVIAAHLDELFPDMEVHEHFPFRVTRDADIELQEGEADDLLAAVEMELRRRRFGEAVRLEVESHCTEEIRELLTRELNLEPEDVYELEAPLDLSGLWAVHGLDRPDLTDETWAPATQPGLATAGDEPVDIFSLLRSRDVLVHHPYDSFSTSVEAFIEQAATDPDVLAIKQTLYRTSGDSPIVKSLIRAAESGKQVATLVELKARFDEQANIAWARALEEVGVHVVYGLVGLKTHCKIALVVRQEPDGLRRYCHVGTGNYNSKTARLYEDIGLLSADADLGADASDLFNLLTGYSRRTDYRRIVLAPTSLRDRMIASIRSQAELGEQGRIVMKMNALADATVIDALYEASQAGVSIDLIVRGICCLRPGVPGLSETIRVRSIVGRYLEHSRIYAFGDDGDDQVLLIGSADLMPRNLDRRIEVVVAVDDDASRERLREILDLNLRDDTNAWELDAEGGWTRVDPDPEAPTNAQQRLYELAQARAKRRRDDLSPPHPDPELGPLAAALQQAGSAP